MSLSKCRTYSGRGDASAQVPAEMHRSQSTEASVEVPGVTNSYSDIQIKNRNFGRLFALLTEKSQNVCSRRVESVWMSEGGRFGRGCGASPKQDQVASIRPSYRFGQRCSPACCWSSSNKTQIKRRKREKERSTGVFCSVAHAASAPPCCYRPARSFCWRLSTVQT